MRFVISTKRAERIATAWLPRAPGQLAELHTDFADVRANGPSTAILTISRTARVAAAREHEFTGEWLSLPEASLISIAGVVGKSGREIDSYARGDPTRHREGQEKHQHFSHRRLHELSLMWSVRDQSLACWQIHAFDGMGDFAANRVAPPINASKLRQSFAKQQWCERGERRPDRRLAGVRKLS